ncbi:hypothetical protein LNK15_00415 [Jeotgalicoccus huakuii]|nr:hypothetical protein [Jeotgalicoccus huakuii]
MYMIKKPKLYPLGFILTDRVIRNVPKYYKQIKISEYYYYHDNISPVKIFKKENFEIIIHGHIVYTDFETTIDGEELLSKLLDEYLTNYEVFLSSTDFLAGRYVIMIIGPAVFDVFQDAVGARSVYYMLNENVLSSHLYLIEDNYECELHTLTSKIKGLDKYFTTTQFENIKSMLPNFKLDFTKKKLQRFFPRDFNKYSKMSDDEKISKIIFLWKKQVKYYSKNYNAVQSLSGGNDSRVSLAMSYDSKEKIEFFTYSPIKDSFDIDDRSSSILNLDRQIVEKLLEITEINHKFIHYDASLLNNEYDRYIKKNSTLEHIEQKSDLLKQYLKSFTKKDTIHIRANLLEIARAHNITERRNNNYKEVLDTIHHRLRGNNLDLLKKELEAYEVENIKNINYDEDLYGYHVLDLFYWELTLGRWHSEVLNSNDIFFDTLVPFNLRTIIEISLSFSLNQRKQDYLFKEMMNNTVPILNFIGVNQVENLYEQSKIRQNKSIFDNFIVRNHMKNYSRRLESLNNYLYIPERDLLSGSEALIELEFNLVEGMLLIELWSRYKSYAANGYLKYEIHVNNQLLLYEDLSKWSAPNSIYINNLHRGDKIIVKVLADRNCQARSWERASKLQIRKVEEIKGRQNVNERVLCTSPYTKII